MAIVTNEGHQEGLEVSLQSIGPFGQREGVVEDGMPLSGGQSVIDFGNCFTGIGHSRVMIIKNVTKSRLNVLLTSDANNDVRFYLDTDFQVFLRNNETCAHSDLLSLHDLILSPTSWYFRQNSRFSTQYPKSLEWGIGQGSLQSCSRNSDLETLNRRSVTAKP